MKTSFNIAGNYHIKNKTRLLLKTLVKILKSIHLNGSFSAAWYRALWKYEI